MTRDEALAAAEQFARQKAWPWEPPFHASRSRRWRLFGRHEWQIYSHADKRGMNVRVVLDDATGEVLESGYLSR